MAHLTQRYEERDAACHGSRHPALKPNSWRRRRPTSKGPGGTYAVVLGATLSAQAFLQSRMPSCNNHNGLAPRSAPLMPDSVSSNRAWQVPQLAKWRFNLTTNYDLQATASLRGLTLVVACVIHRLRPSAMLRPGTGLNSDAARWRLFSAFLSDLSKLEKSSEWRPTSDLWVG